MELETGILETVAEETEWEPDEPEQIETVSETESEPETVSETSGTENPEKAETEMETSVYEPPVSVSGNTVIFPEGFEYMAAEYSMGDSESVIAALDTQTKTIEAQTEAIKEGFAAVCVLLGAVLGVMFVQGFRLRRV